MRKKTKARALSLLLALVMALGLLPGSAWAQEAGPIPIATAEDLTGFRDRVNGGEKTLDAMLTADIELSGVWVPFNPASGYITDAYAGTFDGGGHTYHQRAFHQRRRLLSGSVWRNQRRNHQKFEGGG